MIARTRSYTFVGSSPQAVEVEVDIHRGLPAFSVIGLPDSAVRGSRERIRAALVNSGFEFPLCRIVVNVSPVGLCEQGPGLDVAIAIAILRASGQIDWDPAKTCAIAELALDGTLRPVDRGERLAEAAIVDCAELVILAPQTPPDPQAVDHDPIHRLDSLSELRSFDPIRTFSPQAPYACLSCLRRGWLLARLAPYLEKHLGTPSNTGLSELLALSSEDLVTAVAPDADRRQIAEVDRTPEPVMRASLESTGCWALCRHDPLYPAGLREAPEAPWALFGRGDPGQLADLAEPAAAVAVVGARRASSYGREVARTLGRDLGAAGIAVISGMAFGVDACAHRGALETGRTVAVLGCGPDVAYPASHRSLWRRIQESGLVLSELPPGTGAWRWSFPARSRIIAGLAGITVVVEAAERSGSLITARSAQRLGRAIGAVPGPVTSRVSAGTNDLLADGASLIRDADDILNIPLGCGPAVSGEEAPHPLQLSSEAQAIIGEDRVPIDVLRDLVSTYGSEEVDR